jgi:cbb3-type cytochrome oxidase maturation protein
MWSILILIFLTLCVGIAAWLVFLWAVKSGQYDDVERPKYRMLDDEDKDKKSSNNSSDEAGKQRRV